LVLILVRNNINALGFPVHLSVGFLDRSLFDSN